MNFGEMPESFIETILKRASISYGGCTCDTAERVKNGIYSPDCCYITVEFESNVDYKLFKNSLTTEWKLEEYKSKVIKLFNINLSMSEVWVNFVYPIKEIAFAHVTNIKNLPSMVHNRDTTQDQTLILKEDREFYGDFGRGVYLINIKDEYALQNLCEYFEDNDPTELAIIGGYYSNHQTGNKMFICEDDIAHRGYVVHKGDLILKDYIIEKCGDNLYNSLKQVQEKLLTLDGR